MYSLRNHCSLISNVIAFKLEIGVPIGWALDIYLKWQCKIAELLAKL